MTKLTKDKKYIYRVYDFSGGLMKYYLILIATILVLSGCAGAQKAIVSKTDDGVIYEQAASGIFKAEFYPDGTLKSVESDSKKEPFKLFDIVKPDVEVKQ